MQPPMPLIAGASTALVLSSAPMVSAPLPSACSRTQRAGLLKRMAKPAAQGPCWRANSMAKEPGSSLTRKLQSPCRYSVTRLPRCRATAAKPRRGNSACSRPGSGAANSTNSKPSTPMGFSNCTGCMPMLGCALMAVSGCARRLRRRFRQYSFTCNHLQDAAHHARSRSAGAGTFSAVPAVDPQQHGQSGDRARVPGAVRSGRDRVARDRGAGAL